MARKARTLEQVLSDCCAKLSEFGASGSILYRCKDGDGEWNYGMAPIDGDMAVAYGVTDLVYENWDQIAKGKPPKEAADGD